MSSPVGEHTDRCISCGHDLRARARFCDACGSPITPRATTSEHKQVTVLFADVVGSMKLAAALDAERLREIMNELFNRAAAVVQRYEGTVDKFTGDGLMALFGAPVALEDHALRACVSALEIQAVTAALAAAVLRRDRVALQIRIGLNSGDVIAGDIGAGPGRYTAVGHPVGLAQRMEAAAPPGGVLCTESTARLVEDITRLGPVKNVRVKGAAAPVQARQLHSVETQRKLLGRTDGVMLGRDTDLNRLQSVFDSGRGALVGIVGEPGLGKSRLIGEFAAAAAHRGAEVVVARCEAHASALAFRVLAQLLRGMFKVEGLRAADARERIVAQCAGLVPTHASDMRILFEAMGIDEAAVLDGQVSVDGRRRRLVEVMTRVVQARSTRTVFVLEDAHWIDTPSDEVLAGFAAVLDATTLMFLTTYRPEFHGALQRNSAQTITLQPLDEAVAVRLVGQLLGDDPSLGGLAIRIAHSAAGNPYFIEEIVRDLAGRKVLSGSRGDHRLPSGVDRIAVPPTVQAVLAARIDRLPVDAKSMLNAAAVIGAQFDIDTLRVLRPDAGSTGLSELVSAALIDQVEFVPRQRYCFHHPLVRAVAYESQLSTDRAKAHSRLAAAIERREPSSADENAALIATHFDAAGESVDAYRWHMRAAEWLRPRDLPAAREQWERTRTIADRLPDDQAGVAEMRIAPRTMLVSTSLYVGNDAGTEQRYREFHELATRTDDTRSLAIGMAGQLWAMTANDHRLSEAVVLAKELQDMVIAADWDGEAAGICVNAIAFVLFANCEFSAALQAIDLLEGPRVPAVELSPAHALRGVIELCIGHGDRGRRDLHEGIARARALNTVVYSHVVMYAGVAVALGLCEAGELIDDIEEAWRQAETLGEVSGVICAQWAYGTALLRAAPQSHQVAVDLLEDVRSYIHTHDSMTFALPTVIADLGAGAARREGPDGVLDDLRANLALHLRAGSRVFAGAVGEALIELLIERRSTGDLTEARVVIDQWQTQRPGIPALDLWWLRSRALLAEAEGDQASSDDLVTEYLDLCERLDARGRLADARAMRG
ncbi:AAA family ATPase [Mycobacterium sp. 21AC1]|uniref:ATP-binding protein n=1 Tax=[Mycobacterium] appelbergii TaxID=2939269 RepID=UPI0029391DF0|nr:adenylate/guanylate cyclase domain-containing protein [Mycobacterium sp. 21AC1]MDV3128485.1 AAA family ATPase [Mycobacterium sp. 21AC1]